MRDSFPRSSRRAVAGAVALMLAGSAMAEAVIGVSLPMTGPKALVGRNYKQGVELAVSEINAAGGVLDKPLEVVFQDDQGDNPNGAINAVNKLMQVDKVPVMIGPHYSVTQMATQKTYCNGKVVSLTGGTSVAITHSGCNYVIRTRSDDDVQAKALIDYAQKELKAGEKTAIFYANDDFGKSGQARVVAQMAALGLKPVAVESHNPSDKDYSAQLAKLEKTGAQLVILWAHDTDAALILRQAKQFGLKFKFAGAVLSEDAFLKLAGGAAEGVHLTSNFLPTDPSPNVQHFVEEWKKRSDGAVPGQFPAQAYDAVRIMLAAMEKAQPNPTREKVRDALAQTKDFPGVTGKTTFSADREAEKELVKVEVKGGAFVPVTE